MNITKFLWYNDKRNENEQDLIYQLREDFITLAVNNNLYDLVNFLTTCGNDNDDINCYFCNFKHL